MSVAMLNRVCWAKEAAEKKIKSGNMITRLLRKYICLQCYTINCLNGFPQMAQIISQISQPFLNHEFFSDICGFRSAQSADLNQRHLRESSL
jgi:hypothetical protein